MSLKEYLEKNKIDQIEDDQEFIEAEYNAIRTYCETCGYDITKNDLDSIEDRGLGESFINWKQIYVEDLWQE